MNRQNVFLCLRKMIVKFIDCLSVFDLIFQHLFLERSCDIEKKRKNDSKKKTQQPREQINRNKDAENFEYGDDEGDKTACKECLNRIDIIDELACHLSFSVMCKIGVFHLCRFFHHLIAKFMNQLLTKGIDDKVFKDCQQTDKSIGQNIKDNSEDKSQ